MTTRYIAACQFEPVIGDLETNYERIADLVASLGDRVTLAVFPELCVTGYDLTSVTEYATPVPGALTAPLVDIAADYDTVLVVGLPERDGGSLYNDLVLVDETGVRAVCRKRYLWDKERNVFDAGVEFTICETTIGTVGFLICYDLNFPEAMLGDSSDICDILVVSAAWRAEFLADWKLLLRARALDGTCYVAGSNHVGDQSGRKHAGHSLIVNPRGEIVDTIDCEQGAVIRGVSDIELERARERNPVRMSRSEKSTYKR